MKLFNGQLDQSQRAIAKALRPQKRAVEEVRRLSRLPDLTSNETSALRMLDGFTQNVLRLDDKDSQKRLPEKLQGLLRCLAQKSSLEGVAPLAGLAGQMILASRCQDWSIELAAKEMKGVAENEGQATLNGQLDYLSKKAYRNYVPTYMEYGRNEYPFLEYYKLLEAGEQPSAQTLMTALLNSSRNDLALEVGSQCPGPNQATFQVLNNLKQVVPLARNHVTSAIKICLEEKEPVTINQLGSLFFDDFTQLKVHCEEPKIQALGNFLDHMGQTAPNREAFTLYCQDVASKSNDTTVKALFQRAAHPSDFPSSQGEMLVAALPARPHMSLNESNLKESPLQIHYDRLKRLLVLMENLVRDNPSQADQIEPEIISVKGDLAQAEKELNAQLIEESQRLRLTLREGIEQIYDSAALERRVEIQLRLGE